MQSIIKDAREWLAQHKGSGDITVEDRGFQHTLDVAEAIYESIRNRAIHYSYEENADWDAVQRIRTPSDILEKDLSGINEQSKKGHDYAARVFVIKKTGATPLSNRAINYVFSSNLDIDHNNPSPYTKKSIDYVLSTTKINLNEWVTVKANVKEHFKKLHGLDVNELNGVALMSDTDNSKRKSVAYFQNIFFSKE